MTRHSMKISDKDFKISKILTTLHTFWSHWRTGTFDWVVGAAGMVQTVYCNDNYAKINLLQLDRASMRISRKINYPRDHEGPEQSETGYGLLSRRRFDLDCV